MTLLNWLSPRRQAPALARKPSPTHALRRRLDALEDRSLPSGTPYLFALSGPRSDYPMQEAVDVAGNVYVGGGFGDTVDFDPGSGTVNLVDTTGKLSGFLAKYSPQGGLLWARDFVGTTTSSRVNGVVLSGGSVYAWGSRGASGTGTTDFGNGVTVSSGFAWVARFAEDGTAQWAKGLGVNNARTFAADAAGNVYLGGNFDGTVDFDPGPGVASRTADSGGQSGFVVGLDPAGSYLASFKLASRVFVDALAVDGGAVYCAGSFGDTTSQADFDPGPGTAYRTSAGGTDGFLASYSQAGALNWASTFGGRQDDNRYSSELAFDATGLTVAGPFQGTADFDPSNGTTSLTSAGGTDVHVARYARADGSLVRARRFGGTGDDKASDLATDAAGGVYVSGNFKGTVDFDPGTGVASRTTTGSANDGYLAQFDAAGNFANVWLVAGPGGENVLVGGTAGGLIYATGQFGPADTTTTTATASFPTGGTLTSGGGSDVFVMAFDPAAPPPPASPPTVSVAGGSVAEGGSGRVALTFTVSLSWASDQTVTVYYRTLNGTATAGSDYEYTEGSLTFAPGEITKTVTVWVLGDTAIEANETFSLALYAAPDWLTEIGRAVGTITNDDTKGRK